MAVILCSTGGHPSGDSDQINQYDDNNGGCCVSVVCVHKYMYVRLPKLTVYLCVCVVRVCVSRDHSRGGNHCGDC